MIQIYTDGGSVPNPGYGAWGFVIVKDNEIIHEDSGTEMISSSNKMEMTAVIKGLEYIKSIGIIHNVVVYTDSKYVKNGINEWIYTWQQNGWLTANRKPVKNKVFWERLFSLKEDDFTGLQIKWVKGHNGNEFNEAADTLCTNELRKVFGDFDYEKDKVAIRSAYKKLIAENK